MKYFEHLHPVCILTYFVLVIGMTLACVHPAMAALSSFGAALFLLRLKGWRGAAGWLRFAGILFVLAAAANPLISHRGMTMYLPGRNRR